ncbi:hypothetical protein BRC81_14740 [Halobacteriales archaeon QS_1_68_20]|nr:MAG: hypothetical protein BRC81_14740 [Halobacteriales archaeon QS_1_68_20]
MADEGLDVSRRGALARLGATVALTGAGVTALPSTPESPAPSTVSTGAVRPDATPVPESETSYAVWHYKPVGGDFEPTSPINVVFPLESRSFEDVIHVFHDAGWYPYPEDYPRYAYDRSTDRYRFQDWAGAETYFGVGGRLHVRCWHLDGTASVQAHVDTKATPKHGIGTYAGGRRAVERLFEDAGSDVTEAGQYLGNDQRPDHDGFASVIRS